MRRLPSTRTLVPVVALALAGCHHGGAQSVECERSPRYGLLAYCQSRASSNSPPAIPADPCQGGCSSEKKPAGRCGCGSRDGDCPGARPDAPACPHCGVRHNAAPRAAEGSSPAVLGAPQTASADEFGHSILNEGDAGIQAGLVPGTREAAPVQTASSLRRQADEFNPKWFAETSAKDQIEPWPYHGLGGNRPQADQSVNEDDTPAYPHAPDTGATEPTALSVESAAVPLHLFVPSTEPRVESASTALPIITPGPTARR